MSEEKGSFEVKVGLAEMLKGGVIMDVTNAEQAKIAEDAGACAVMALERVPAREENSGPVAYLAPFADEEEAIAMTNQTDYGLANSVWTEDPARADRVARRMVAGSSWVNCHNVFPLGVPFSGVNQSGLGGGVNSPDTLGDYFRKLSVVRPA